MPCVGSAGTRAERARDRAFSARACLPRSMWPADGTLRNSRTGKAHRRESQRLHANAGDEDSQPTLHCLAFSRLGHRLQHRASLALQRGQMHRAGTSCRSDDGQRVRPHCNGRRVSGDSDYASQNALIQARAPQAKSFTNHRVCKAGEIDEVQRSTKLQQVQGARPRGTCLRRGQAAMGLHQGALSQRRPRPLRASSSSCGQPTSTSLGRTRHGCAKDVYQARLRRRDGRDGRDQAEVLIKSTRLNSLHAAWQGSSVLSR
jgi:hypothetical protein